MSRTWAILKKEFRGFVLSPNFLLVCGLAAMIMSWVYPMMLSRFSREIQQSAMFGQQQMSDRGQNIHYFVFVQHLSYLNLMLMFICPALTMRLFAEEKKLRTYDLLLTSPITSAQIVAGKYLAVVGALACLMVLSFLYPLTTTMFAKIQWGPLLIAYLGIFMVAILYAAVDLFCSSLTESAIVSYVMAVILNLAVWFLGNGVEVVDSSWAREVFEHISLSNHLSALVEGTIRTNGLVFMGSVIFLFTFLAERVVESSRWR